MKCKVAVSIVANSFSRRMKAATDFPELAELLR
jgi:hypothetical protein